MNPSPSHDDAQVARLGRLYIAVVADVLDRLGLRSQVMSHRMRPVAGGERLCGRGYPIQALPSRSLREDPYEREIAAVDSVPPGSVVVASTGGVDDAALWGELLATRASARGAVGAVVDGGVRDLAGLARLGFPTFATAVSANDSWGRIEVVSYGEAIVCAGVGVEAGDLVLGDLDGVVVVPAEAAEEVLARAEQKRSKEDLARNALEQGASVAEVYSRHEVL